MDVNGKTVLITGASSGIGRALARILARRGARTALVARNGQALRDLAAEIEAAGANSMAAVADVTDRAAVDRAVLAAVARFGGIDILVNCAGLGYFGPIETMPMEHFDLVIRTNLHGTLNAIQACLPSLKAARGMIVNVSSGLAGRALPFLAAYAGTKSMVNALSDGMRLELAPYGIKVLAFLPPTTDTGFDTTSIKGAGMEGVDFAASGMKPSSAEKVASALAKAIAKDKRQVGGGFFRVMNAVAPRMLDRMFSAMVKRFTP
jgi:short-subunit dehydrogenase